MQHDPTDETFRKARRLRNTPLQKYIRLTSAFVTLAIAGAMYISYRRNILPYLDDERYKISEDDLAMQNDYMRGTFLEDIVIKLNEKREAASKTITEAQDKLKNTQANKD